MNLQCILVPIDFSDDADQALHDAIALAQKHQGCLRLLHVRDNSNMNPWFYTAQEETQAKQSMAAYLQRVQDTGVGGESTIAHGKPWQEIVEMAKAKDVDLVLMGTRGRTGLPTILLGSVAERVVRQAPCSVMVSRKRETKP